MSGVARPDGPPELYVRQPPAMVVTVQQSMVVGHFDHGAERYGLRIPLKLGPGLAVAACDEKVWDRRWRQAEDRAVSRMLEALRLTWALLLAPDRGRVVVENTADIACVTPPGGAFMVAPAELVRDVTP